MQTVTVVETADGAFVITKDANGNVTQEHMPTVSVTPEGQSTDASNPNPNSTTSDTPPSTTSDTPATTTTNSDDGGGDTTAAATPTPPPAEGEEEPAQPADAEAEETAVVTPLHPDFQNDSGSGLELLEATDGRFGGREARTTLKGIGFKAGGGGAAGPTNPESQTSSGVLLTPEEQKNAARAIGIGKSGGVTDPANTDEAGAPVATDRDLRELILRGTGGAKGPVTGDSGRGSVPPQPPQSPITGPIPAPVPASINVTGAALKVAPQISEKIKVNVQQANP